MAVNKVVYDGNTLIDLTDDSVTPETLASGATAHSADGTRIVGTMRTVDELLENVTVNDTLTWDGNTEGKTVFDMMGDGSYTYYPVSDAVITLDDLANGLILESSDINGIAPTEVIRLTDFAKMTSNVIASRSVSSVLFVLADNATLYGSTIPKKGVYFMSSEAFGVYVSRIKIEGYTGFNTDIEVIKEKYIPEHSHDWEDITNRPEVINGTDGEDGEDGYTPIKGVDYYTEDEKAEWSQYIATELAKRGQLRPEYAQSEEWLAENGDQSKMYVLPDGMIWAWMLTEKEVSSGSGYKNLLPEATDTDDQIIDGGDYDGDGDNDGYKTSTRLSGSSGNPSSSQAAMCASGFIRATDGAVVRIKGASPVSGVSAYIISYNSSKTKLNY